MAKPNKKKNVDEEVVEPLRVPIVQQLCTNAKKLELLIPVLREFDLALASYL